MQVSVVLTEPELLRDRLWTPETALTEVSTLVWWKFQGPWLEPEAYESSVPCSPGIFSLGLGRSLRNGSVQ